MLPTTMPASTPAPTPKAWPASGDWAGWADTWEARMRAFFPRRAECITAIGDVLAELLPAGPWRLLDLGAGAGGLARALLARFPDATVVALDLDPVLLAIGRGALGDGDGRLSWRQIDLRAPDWAERLGAEAAGGFDAVVSLATLHHFSSRELASIYGAVVGLIRPGGLVLNAEGLAAGPPASLLARQFDASRRRGAPPADGWWEAVAADPAVADAVAERERLRDRMRSAGRNRSAEAHCRALRRAGFAEAALAWRYLDEALVVGRR
jgi:SAM-dependent methyltransferase